MADNRRCMIHVICMFVLTGSIRPVIAGELLNLEPEVITGGLAASISPNSDLLTVGLLGELQVWDLKTRTMISSSLEGRGGSFTPDSKSLRRLDGELGQVRWFNARTLQEECRIDDVPKSGFFSKNGKLFLSNYGDPRLFDGETFTELPNPHITTFERDLT